MKKLIVLLSCIGIVVLIGLAGCVTINQENVAKGKLFKRLHLAHYDSSLPIEEQCYVIVLGDAYTFLSTIDGEKASPSLTAPSVHRNEIIIVRPGVHTFSFTYRRESSRESSSMIITTITKAEGDKTVDLLPGHYYFLTSEVSKDYIVFQFDDLENHSSQVINTSNFTKEVIPVTSIIEGINAVIAKKFKGFTGGKKRRPITP